MVTESPSSSLAFLLSIDCDLSIEGYPRTVSVTANINQTLLGTSSHIVLVTWSDPYRLSDLPTSFYASIQFTNYSQWDVFSNKSFTAFIIEKLYIFPERLHAPFNHVAVHSRLIYSTSAESEQIKKIMNRKFRIFVQSKQFSSSFLFVLNIFFHFAYILLFY